MQILNIFYEEPANDRWFKYDRYPRKIIRRLIRGKEKPGGVMMIALQLMKGLNKIGVSYRFNDFKYIKNHPDEVACIIGKPQILNKIKWKNPIIYGAGIFSHPVDQLDFLKINPTIKKLLVPGPWMKNIFDSYYDPKIVSFWPAGIDVEQWHPKIKNEKPTTDFLIYDKVRWLYDEFDKTLILPIKEVLIKHNLTFETIRYGHYNYIELITKLATCRAVIFLCEHETQGQAYQQILSTGTPILAWDRGGFWKDPAYFPHRVKYEPVTSVPYWDKKCGLKFKNTEDFEKNLNHFMSMRNKNLFDPRAYIIDNLTLEISAQQYVDIYNSIL